MGSRNVLENKVAMVAAAKTDANRECERRRRYSSRYVPGCGMTGDQSEAMVCVEQIAVVLLTPK